MGNASGRSDLQSIRKQLELGNALVAVVVVNDGIDHGLAQGDRIKQANFLAFFRGNARQGSIFEIQLVENLFGCLDQAAIAVFLVFNQINPVSARILGDFDGCVVDVGQ